MFSVRWSSELVPGMAAQVRFDQAAHQFAADQKIGPTVSLKRLKGGRGSNAERSPTWRCSVE